MNVVFVEPAFPPTQRHFVCALPQVGATVIGIGERSGDALEDEPRGWMAHDDRLRGMLDDAGRTVNVYAS